MDKIKTTLLSYGMSGKVFHAPFLTTHPGFHLSGAWERSKKQIQKDYPWTKSFDSLKEVLESDAELVVVNTPNLTHFEFTAACLRAGKHVMVEKAFTTNAQEAIELENLAKQQGLVLTIFQNRRWDSDFLTTKKILESEKLGTIVEAQLSYDRYNPTLSPKVHKETLSQGSGILKDLGPHLIDQALVLFGLPQAVYADLRITREHSQVDDYFELILFYPEGRARLHSGYFVKEPGPAYILHGKNGSFLKHRSDIQETALQAGRKPDEPEWGREPDTEAGLLHLHLNGQSVKERVPTEPGNYRHFYEGVFQSIRHQGKPPVTPTEGIAVMKIIDAALQSQAEGKKIDLNFS
ncbi:MAG: Gfo/Idh/MocA family oxidoreductase [Bacteroidetes bacterium]|nr:Gfo/Idh/MocA family oxidoreductase [Bacteroidota bacterium]